MVQYNIILSSKTTRLLIHKNGVLKYTSGVFDAEDYFIFDIKDKGVLKLKSEPKEVKGMIGNNELLIDINGNFWGNSFTFKIKELNKLELEFLLKSNFTRHKWLSECQKIKLELNFFWFGLLKSITLELKENSVNLKPNTLDLLCAEILVFFWCRYDQTIFLDKE